MLLQSVATFIPQAIITKCVKDCKLRRLLQNAVVQTCKVTTHCNRMTVISS